VVGDELVHVPEAAGQELRAVGGLERLPFRAPLQPLDQALVVDAPPAGQEVEVMGAIRRTSRCAGRSLSNDSLGASDVEAWSISGSAFRKRTVCSKPA
jgi:hypothetical protein